MKEINAQDKNPTLNSRISSKAIVLALVVLCTCLILVVLPWKTGDDEAKQKALDAASTKINALKTAEEQLRTQLSEESKKAEELTKALAKSEDANKSLKADLIRKDTLLQDRTKEHGILKNENESLREMTKALAVANKQSSEWIFALTAEVMPNRLPEMKQRFGADKNDLSKHAAKAKSFALTELLKDFTLASDEFTRPKRYRHTGLNVYYHSQDYHHKESICGKCTFFNFSVDTTGKLSGSKFDSLLIVRDDEVTEYKGLQDLQKSFLNDTKGLSSLRCRIKWKGKDDNTPYSVIEDRQVDFTLNEKEMKAIRESLELSILFSKEN